MERTRTKIKCKTNTFKIPVYNYLVKHLIRKFVLHDDTNKYYTNHECLENNGIKLTLYFFSFRQEIHLHIQVWITYKLHLSLLNPEDTVTQVKTLHHTLIQRRPNCIWHEHMLCVLQQFLMFISATKCISCRRKLKLKIIFIYIHLHIFVVQALNTTWEVLSSDYLGLKVL